MMLKYFIYQNEILQVNIYVDIISSSNLYKKSNFPYIRLTFFVPALHLFPKRLRVLIFLQNAFTQMYVHLKFHRNMYANFPLFKYQKEFRCNRYVHIFKVIRYFIYAITWMNISWRELKSLVIIFFSITKIYSVLGLHQNCRVNYFRQLNEWFVNLAIFAKSVNYF